MKKMFILLLASLGGACEGQKELKSEVEVVSSGLLSCVNNEKGVTCFGGRYPNKWDGVSLPNVPIVLHRPGRRSALVGMFQVCLDDGSCLGDPIMGSSETAYALLRPIEFSKWQQVEAGLNIICGLDKNGGAQCWGKNWGVLLDGTSDQIRQPVGTFEHFSLSPTHFCGSTGKEVSCQPLSHYGAELHGAFQEYEGFENSCSSLEMDCAQSILNPTKVTCWYRDRAPLEMKGVLEYGCGRMVCVNRGAQVECHSGKGETKQFPVKIRKLTVGSQHFCGIDDQSRVVCRIFGELVKDDPEVRNTMELLSHKAWEELKKK